MKILFIHPNDYLNIGIPTGIATLSAILKREGHETDVFDFTFIKTEEYIKPRSDESKKVGTANKGIFLPTEYTLADLVEKDPVQSLREAFEKKIKEFQPDLIAVSVMTGYFDRVIELLRAVKLPCKVIVGGVHATIAPEDALSFDIVDFICVGEGEGLFLELCVCLEEGKDYSKIKNLGYKKNGHIYINELRPFFNFDELPTPDWSLFDERHLFRPLMGKIYKGSFYVMSRGCPQLCTYCVNGSLRERYKGCGQYFRYQSPKTTIKHLSSLKEKFGATWFKFADDSIMLLSEEYLEELAAGLKPLNIQFGCSVRPETTTEGKVEILKSMGCVAASVGVESGNETVRKTVLNRHMSNQTIKRSVSILKNAGIRVSTFNMIGLPEETRENVFETISLNRELNVDSVNVYIVYPYPGTGISKKYNIKLRGKDGKMTPVNKSSSFAFSKMPPEEVEGLLRTFDLYLKLPEEIWPVVKIAEGRDKAAEELRKMLTDCAINFVKNKNANQII